MISASHAETTLRKTSFDSSWISSAASALSLPSSVMNQKKDERRPLDEEGMLQARYVGRLLANLDVQVDQIISSSLKRARQTATLVANELAFEAAVQIDNALRPEAEFDQFQTMLARYKKYDAVMVVGHNPSLTEFLSKSVSGVLPEVASED